MGKKNASIPASATATATGKGETITVSTSTTTATNRTEHGNLASDPLPSIKVNPAHLQEIKSSLDDAVKKVSPRFHTISSFLVARCKAGYFMKVLMMLVPRITLLYPFLTASHRPPRSGLHLYINRHWILSIFAQGRFRILETCIMARGGWIFHITRIALGVEEMGRGGSSV